MVRHIVAWNFNEGMTESEKRTAGQTVKEKLEVLHEKIPGIVSIQVITDVVGVSNRNILLTALFESEEALAIYQAHDEHKRAGEYVRSVTRDRACVDYIE